jgi:hypothetical protein
MFEPKTHELENEELNTVLDIIVGEDGSRNQA